jgi:HEAT repeat protein
VVALARIGEPAVEPLIDALKDENSEVRESATEALARIGKPAVEPLTEALKDENSEVHRLAAKSLDKIKAKKS